MPNTVTEHYYYPLYNYPFPNPNDYKLLLQYSQPVGWHRPLAMGHQPIAQLHIREQQPFDEYVFTDIQGLNGLQPQLPHGPLTHQSVRQCMGHAWVHVCMA